MNTHEKAILIAKELNKTFKELPPCQVPAITANAWMVNSYMTETLGSDRTKELLEFGEDAWRLAWDYFSVTDYGDLEEIEYLAKQIN